VKKLLLILLCLPLLFSSCKKEEIDLRPCLCQDNKSYLNELIFIQNGTSETIFGVIWIPNAFTPNSDGVNDYFSFMAVGITNYNLDIYKDGTLIFSGDSSWSGESHEEGAYNYTLDVEFLDSIYNTINGTVSLIRNFSSSESVFKNFPSGKENCSFSDMIDPQYGFVFPTQEDINNWGN